MLHLFISQSWIASRNARRLYFACALMAICLTGELLTSRAEFWASLLSSSASPVVGFFVRLLIFLSIVGAALLTIAMWYFWFGFDTSSWIKKALWLLPLYLLVPIGPILYYFFVYSRNDLLRKGLTIFEKDRTLAGASLS
ncbi:MAG TPA: hypothetical protein VGG46_10800 [Terriglobales bacterium]|jgi:hypothetical protein